MLSTNVLCIKKRKKKSYCIVNRADKESRYESTKRSAGGAATMLQITEDTPPDMLAGAMDLTVHLPTGRSVKMSVERSTPMMDLLVHITTNYHLQLSGYTLQALGMAPSKEHSDVILPYKPNTPIGTLDTQHIKVIPKAKSVTVARNVAPGHQPFESTFRLKVHLPRNQLFVTRVSQSVHLEDIMKKVCEEKSLDVLRYEFRHPGNLDEILDPKSTLSDYAITEIYLVQKGSGSLNQAFSTGDIMALRKEEERKQMHNKTGGGVFNLIFRRGKSSSGSLSSETRSISPTHSDDSRSVTPPAVQPQIIAPPEPDKPKPPQRKRRPAPKPPSETKKNDNSNTTGLTICHSRNSSDSSGYHEASVLSDNCNTSLPRRPKSTMIGEETQQQLGQHSQSTSNLSKMTAQSKSTSSLAFPSRKKKTAPPPPPPVLKPEKTPINLEEPSPVVASQPRTVAQAETHGKGQDVVVNNTNPKPRPRTRTKTAPSPRPRSIISVNSEDGFPEEKIAEKSIQMDIEDNNTKESIRESTTDQKKQEFSHPRRIIPANSADRFPEEKIAEKSIQMDIEDNNTKESIREFTTDQKKREFSHPRRIIPANSADRFPEEKIAEKSIQVEIEDINSKEPIREFTRDQKKQEFSRPRRIISANSADRFPEEKIAEKSIQVEIDDINSKEPIIEPTTDQKKQAPEPPKQEIIEIDKSSRDEEKKLQPEVPNKEEIQANKPEESEKKEPQPVKPPEIVAVYPKTDVSSSKSLFDSFTRKRGLQMGKSLRDDDSDLSTPNSVASALNSFDFVDEIDNLDEEMFTGSLSKNSKNKNVLLNQLHGMHELENLKKNPSGGSLRSVRSLPGFMSSNMKKWSNVEELDDISLNSYSGRNGWVIGDPSDTESIASTTNTSQPLDSLASVQSLPLNVEEQEKPKEIEVVPEAKPPSEKEPPKENELDGDWQYQLPSPPKAFRDSSPVAFTELNHESVADSVVTSPELFEKLKVVKDQSEKESDLTSTLSEEEKPILNKLSLENLEKRKSLVYNRELATSLKMSEEDKKNDKNDTFSSSLMNFEKTYDEVKRSSLTQVITTSTLPNFKITTYDNPKKKIDIFEDDTISSNDRGSKRNSFAEPSFPLQKSYVGRSMENISFRKNSTDNEFNKQEYKFYKPPPVPRSQNIYRSESFSKEQTWVPNKPVTRSKSQVALNKYKDMKNLSQVDDDNLTKSNSLFDVSGLQSLGVMRLIQNKLNTPNASTEQLDKEEPSYQKQPEIKSEVQNHVEEKPAIKTYQYRPPSINMGTWSERPKIPVNVKDDPDYKYSVKETNTSRLIVNSVNNHIKSHNSIEVKSKTSNFSSNGVSVRVNPDSVNKNIINVNGSESINRQNSGNVVIKIGGNTQTHTRAVFRKPLGNVNTENQRPHSIAFGSDFDISRVPIVRSVEFKKPYKEFQTNNNNNNNTSTLQNNNNNNNTSITHIGPNNWNRNGYKEHSETVIKPQVEPKPVFRVNSYLQKTSAPVVRGFRSTSNETNRVSWNQPHSFSTLPAKPKNYALNAPVPFSQSNLRRTESSIEKKNVPPPAPVMPKTFTSNVKSRDNFTGDPKEQLLQAIRDFGGKKGLRAVKA